MGNRLVRLILVGHVTVLHSQSATILGFILRTIWPLNYIFGPNEDGKDGKMKMEQKTHEGPNS